MFRYSVVRISIFQEPGHNKKDHIKLNFFGGSLRK